MPFVPRLFAAFRLMALNCCGLACRDRLCCCLRVLFELASQYCEMAKGEGVSLH
jgi:hypothetical protein